MTASSPRPTTVRRATALAAALTLLLPLTACGERPSEQSRDTDKPLVIGTSLPLTGDFSQPGSEAKRGYEIWRNMVNAKGGVLGRQVQLKIADDASSQDTVVADYTRLITQDRVDLLLGTFSSLLNHPASAVAEKNRMVFVEPAGGAPNMFDRGFKYLFFAQPATAPRQADVFVDYIKSLPADQRPKTAAYPSQDDPFAAPVIESMRQQLEPLGVRTVYRSTYPADTTNFQSVASTLADRKPDLIAQGAVFEDGVGLVRSLKQLNYSPKMLFQTSAPSNSSQYANGVGVANTEGVFYTVSWNQAAKTPLNAEFVAAYKKAYNNADPAEDAADAFAAAQVLQAAVEAVGEVNQDKIRDWLHANTVQTILGPLSWKPTGEPNGKFLLAQWQSGRVQVVGPPNLATSRVIINPKPGWK
ncbi:branched-chain amino acid ABC transporter substrate-binding protein [Actinomadura sp. NBRC 104412]|uniref:amino acid ABC transporter substrate-binding protein n=1 Tax=Actinomadura sp. NBRC 104412 TaxID=3032203 RepID=UPI0024A209A9|nr:amino acid ABC transporter substrate-binding protein [Actinomadura sp. NBRC 104412]GLZ05589.1 branched-chain amino acid ABC transporter substrate-binding protein [Actinomadura sp. NBRC 104412]